MATTTRERLRALLATATGFYYGGTNTGTATTTVVDTGILRWDTGRLIDRWVLMTAGNNDGQSRRISAVSSSTATVGTAFSGSNANGNTFEILPFDPDIMHYALEEAMRTVWPKPARLGRAAKGLYARRTDDTLVVDNLIATNNSFETAVSGSPTATSGWTKEGTSTLSDETTLRRHLTNSLKVIETTTSAVTQLHQTVTPNITEAVGKTINLRVWVYATEASAARVGISFDNGTSITYSNYHGGEDEWEDLDVSTAITASAASIRVYLEVAADQTAYFDLARAWIDKVNRYTLSTSFYRGPVKIDQQASMSKPDGDYFPLTRHNPAQPGRVLRRKGKHALSAVTSETGTMEISEPQDQILYAHALEWLADSNIGMASGVARDDIEADRQRWRVKAAELRGRASIRTPYQPIYAEQNGAWEIQWEGETSVLLLTNR